MDIIDEFDLPVVNAKAPPYAMQSVAKCDPTVL